MAFKDLGSSGPPVSFKGGLRSLGPPVSLNVFGVFWTPSVIYGLKVKRQKLKDKRSKLKGKHVVLARLLEWSCEKFMCHMRIIHMCSCENYGVIPVVFSQIEK